MANETPEPKKDELFLDKAERMVTDGAAKVKTTAGELYDDAKQAAEDAVDGVKKFHNQSIEGRYASTTDSIAEGIEKLASSTEKGWFGKEKVVKHIEADTVRPIVPVVAGALAAGAGILLFEPIKKACEFIFSGPKKIVEGLGLNKIPLIGGLLSTIADGIASIGEFAAMGVVALAGFVGYSAFSPKAKDSGEEKSVIERALEQREKDFGKAALIGSTPVVVAASVKTVNAFMEAGAEGAAQAFPKTAGFINNVVTGLRSGASQAGKAGNAVAHAFGKYVVAPTTRALNGAKNMASAAASTVRTTLVEATAIFRPTPAAPAAVAAETAAATTKTAVVVADSHAAMDAAHLAETMAKDSAHLAEIAAKTEKVLEAAAKAVGLTGALKGVGQQALRVLPLVGAAATEYADYGLIKQLEEYETELRAFAKKYPTHINAESYVNAADDIHTSINVQKTGTHIEAVSSFGALHGILIGTIIKETARTVDFLRTGESRISQSALGSVASMLGADTVVEATIKTPRWLAHNAAKLVGVDDFAGTAAQYEAEGKEKVKAAMDQLIGSATERYNNMSESDQKRIAEIQKAHKARTGEDMDISRAVPALDKEKYDALTDEDKKRIFQIQREYIQEYEKSDRSAPYKPISLLQGRIMLEQEKAEKEVAAPSKEPTEPAPAAEEKPKTVATPQSPADRQKALAARMKAMEGALAPKAGPMVNAPSVPNEQREKQQIIP